MVGGISCPDSNSGRGKRPVAAAAADPAKNVTDKKTNSADLEKVKLQKFGRVNRGIKP